MKVLKTLEMSVTNVYMVTTTNLHKYDLLKPQEQSFIYGVITSMRTCDIFPILQKGPKHFKETHGMSFNVCDNDVQDQGCEIERKQKLWRAL